MPAVPAAGRRRRPLARIAALALALAASGCFGEDLPQVETEAVGPGTVTQTVSAPATVQAAATQEVAAGVSGVVVALKVDDNARVNRGQTVLRLASDQVDRAREQAKAAAAAADAGAGVAVDGSGDATLQATADAVARLDASTRPRIAEARRRAAEIKIKAQRAAALAAVDAVEASYESTRAALVASGEVAAAQQDAIAQSLSQALNQAVESATAGQRVQAQAAAEALDAQADELVVSAPFAGTVQLGEAAAADGGAVPPGVPPELAGAVGSLGGLAGGDGGGGTLRVGAPVTAGQTLFSVYDLSQLYVTADVDEVDAPQVKPGQSATVLVDAFPDATFDGIVEEINVAAEVTEAGGVGYPVRIRILGPADGSPKVKRRALRVGMTASAEIDTKTATSDLVVPSRALLRRDGGDVVYVVRDGRVAVVDVKVIALGEDRAAVRGDLRPDERVVVAGYEDLVDGDRVTAT